MSIPDALTDYITKDQERKHRQKELIRHALSVSPIPVADDLRNAVATLFVTDARDVLRAHPGFDLEDKLRSIRTTLQLFDQAFADLLDALAAFDAFSRRPEFSYRSQRAEHDLIERRIRKEIFAFSELAHSLQDHSRHVKSRWEASVTAQRIAACFGDDGLHDFVCGLRTVLHHLLMLDASWEIRGSGAEATSHYLFKTHDLLDAAKRKKKLNSDALRYLASCDENIDIGELAPIYHRRVHNFYDPLLANPPAEVADYRRCWNAHRQRSARTIWAFMLSEFQSHGVDPYSYLDRFLTPAEIETARRLPHRSQEQVDFIISSIDEFSACDEALRRTVYQLFGVFSNQETEQVPST